MEERTVGLILRTRPLTETSLIVQWLTRDFGRVSTVAKGARRAKSPFAGKLDLFYEADLSFQRSRMSELHALRELSVRHFHSALRRDIGLLQQAAYFAQLIELTTETQTPIPDIFRLLQSAIASITDHPPNPTSVFAFETKLLNELGLNPTSRQGNMTAGAKELLCKFISLDWPSLGRLRLSLVQGKEIHQYLHKFLAFHAGPVPSGRNAALSCHRAT